MDLLYSRYASPFEFMARYIEQGRFAEFVENIVEMENKRRQEEDEKTSDDRLWTAYLLSGNNEQTFAEWKSERLKQSKKQPVSLSMTAQQVEDQKEKSRNILKNFNL